MPKLRAKSLTDRLQFLKSKGLCFGCLKYGHLSRRCRARAKCKECNATHPTLLHREREQQDNQDSPRLDTPKTTDQGNSCSTNMSSGMDRARSQMGAGAGLCTMAVIPVRVRSPTTHTTVETYAFLDPGSNVTFCTENLAQQLGVTGKATTMELHTMGQSQKFTTHRISGLEVCGLDNGSTVELPLVYTKPKMPVTRDLMPTQEDIDRYEHLREIELPVIQAEVGMLIGNNVPAAFTPQELRTGQENEPHGARSVLGWIIWGMVRSRDEPCHLSNLQLAREEAGQLQRLENMVRASIDMDFPGRLVDSKKEPSVEDKQFEEIIGTTLKLVGDHYQCDLPFREPACKLEDNRFHAMDRLMSLKKKLRNNPTFNQDYVTFMSSLMEKGYAEKVTDAPEDSRERVGRWYMPHHGIYNPTKPGKIRVVFDCLAKTRGVSLNDVLLPGPILTNKVVDVLLRFRQQPIGLIGDIEGMFFQVRVSERHRDFLRYLWFPEGDTSRPPETYRLKAHPFGAISSPSCASAALRKCATDNEHQEILRKFYVDDYLCASFDATEAIETRKIVKEVCRRGGFNLHKWVSNSKAVNDSIPPEERSKSQQLNIESIDPPQSERALGVFWNTVEDNFGFKVNLKHRPATRRGILSVISSVFDPLELAGPFILPARIMLQRLCKQDLEWDKEIGERETVAWNQWLLNIVKLEQMSIPRSVRPSDFVDVATCQLHAFSDASDEGYGIAIYTRHEDSSGRVFCNLLMGKSRVAPLKKVTTPRMELTAASLSVKFIALITSALELHFNVFYWTDSTSVL